MRTIKCLALAACCAMTCVACVDEPTSVSLNGVISPHDSSCQNPGSNPVYVYKLQFDSSIKSSYAGTLNLKNNMTTASPWKSSGGSSGSGSTLDVTLPDKHSVYLDELVFECVEIDGDASACDGQSDYTQKFGNLRVEANSVLNAGFLIQPTEFGWGDFKSCVVSVYAKWHDNGIMSGESSHISLLIEDIAELKLFEQFQQQCEAKGGELSEADNPCARWGQDDPSYSMTCSK